MLKHHTKEKGDLGVLKAQLSLFEQGYLILQPVTEHAPFDLVVYKDNAFKRVQVKYKTLDKTGAITLHFRSCWTDKNGTHMQAVDKEQIDLYCIYCPNTDECYFLNPKDFDKSVTLRVEPPKNNQNKHVKFVADYQKVP
ncbi:MAG: group I intron-associated PD-(D/E)XK endonuclease [Gammaproteobacteria bacterium]|nr:group I intron-associated PD-(D/E)XK endonuclease [Gammaproteobacteria bacterium]MCW8987972.1 group I intron-associated PD-(D/E)XK endonuclease [Gammaproteobacteria bacterium]MCW9030434.1 group I intron-associated PD-(D/E)XK endonuclease [Gammaproteobacteria bacterium]